MAEQFEVTERFTAPPAQLYEAWLDSEQHGAMTGSAAEIEPGSGGKFSAWDGYIFGTTLELEENRRIVQAWRTTEFSPDDPDSRVEITFEVDGAQTVLTIRHTGIPDGQGEDYHQGWIDYYFAPMHGYLEH